MIRRSQAILFLVLSLGATPARANESFRNEVPAAGARSRFALAAPSSATLPNGMTLITVNDASLPLVHARVVVRAGHGQDPTNRRGLARLHGDLLARGTVARTRAELVAAFELVGATIGTSVSPDATHAGATVLSPKLDETVGLLAEVIRTPRLDPNELDEVRRALLSRIGKSSQRSAYDIFNRALWGSHPYAFGSSGRERDLRAVRVEDVKRFRRAYVNPGSTALIVVGRIASANVYAIAERHFGSWAGAGGKITLPEPPRRIGRVMLVEQPGAKQATVLVGSRGVPRSDPDYLPLTLMNQILGGSFSSRLNTKLREEKGYTYRASSHLYFLRGGGSFVASTTVRNDVVVPTVREIIAQIEGMKRQGVTKTELATAKTAFIESLPSRYQALAGVAKQLADAHVHQLPLGSYRTLSADIETVSAASVRRVAGLHLHPKDSIIVVAGPRSLAASLKSLGRGDVKIVDIAWQDEAAKAARAKAPAPAAVAPPVERPASGPAAPAPKIRVRPLLSAEAMKKIDIKKIAVPPIVGTGIDSNAVAFLSEVAIDAAVEAARFQVIGSSDIEAMLAFENQRDLLGCSDVACMAQIGGALGVDAILTIKVGRLGGTFRTNASLIDIRSSKPVVRASATSTAPLEHQLSIVEEVVRAALGALP